MDSVLDRFGDYAAAHPSVISDALDDEFGVVSLAKVANRNGYEITVKEVDGLLTEMVSNSMVRVSYKDDDGEIRELTLDEAQLAGGGIALALAAAVVTVVVLVVAGAGVITAAAVVVSTSVWAHTSVWTYASSTLPNAAQLPPGSG